MYVILSQHFFAHVLTNTAPIANKLKHAEPVKPFRLRGDQHLILRPTTDGPMEVRFSRISSRGKLVTYSVYRPDGVEVTSGMMSGKVPLIVKPGRVDYYHLVIAAGTASYMVNVTGAAWAADGNLSDQGLHFLGTMTPLYFYVGDATTDVLLSLEAQAPGKTAIATLYDPNGQKMSDFDCTKISVDRQKIKVTAGQVGWWKLDVQKPPTTAIDDVWVKLDAPHSGYFSLDPDQAVVVR